MDNTEMLNNLNIIPSAQSTSTNQNLKYLSGECQNKTFGARSKKQKFENQVESSTEFCTNFDILPDEIVIEIFSYLSIKDKCQAKQVCNRWNKLIRSKVLWKYVKLISVSSAIFIKFIPSLPSCVLHLRIKCSSETLPFNLSEMLLMLHERCPLLRTFILEDAYLVNNLHSPCVYNTRQIYKFYTPLLQSLKEYLSLSVLQDIESKYFTVDNIKKYRTILPELRVLSLRVALFNYSHFVSYTLAAFPELKVLDLSYSNPMTSKYVTTYSTMTELEELYLTNWHITNNFMEKYLRDVRKLRVLDLEQSTISESTISILKKNCVHLNELYLACTHIGDNCWNNEEKCFFPQLESLCIKMTDVSNNGAEIILNAYPSLKHIDLTLKNGISETWRLCLYKELRKKVIIHKTEASLNCNHFIKNKHYIH